MLAVLAIPALVAPLACTAILGDFTVGSGSSDAGPVNDVVVSDGPTDTTHFIDAVQVASGQNHTCALRATGEVFCWGDNSLGQLGTSAVTGTSATPVKVANLQNIRAISAGNNHTCAVDGDDTSGGTVHCWGSNSKGQLGAATPDHSAIPLQVTGFTNNPLAVIAGHDHACTFDSAGSVYCWGENDKGQIAGTPGASIPSPTAVSIGTGAKEVSPGAEVTCAVLADGTLQCWGTSSSGEIPSPDGGTAFTPTTVTFIDAGVNHVAAGVSHVCATDSSGNSYCWGANDFGQTGQAATGGVTTPAVVAGLGNVGAIGAGESYSCGLTLAKYGVSCWGSNSYGALGNGQPSSASPQPSPQEVAGLSGVGQISIGSRHGCAILKPVPAGLTDKASGPLYCWGDNSTGQLGDGTQGNQKSSPVQVSKPPN